MEINKQFLDVNDVQKTMGVSRSMAYQIIRELNMDLQKAGYLTVRGKISASYFEEKTHCHFENNH